MNTATKTLRCDMCHKPLTSKRFQIVSGSQTLTVGPDCYKKEKAAAEAATIRSQPAFKDFTAWLRATNASNRACPAGNFPHNFNHWQAGGRW